MEHHSKTTPILLVEDNPGDAQLVGLYLNSAESFQFELTHVETLKAAAEVISSAEFPIILLVLGLPDGSDIEPVQCEEQSLLLLNQMSRQHSISIFPFTLKKH